MTTIKEFYGYGDVKPWTSNKAVPLDNPMPNLLYGIELEIENIGFDRTPNGFRLEGDGSLRNGIELIGHPMTYSNLHYCLTQLFDKYKMDPAVNYSERCSTHVHTDAHNLTVQQVAAIVLLYQVFERLLFRYVGRDRGKNIFCVPWHDTTMTAKVVHNMFKGHTHTFRTWQKYTALNLIPLTTQGTLEWRHLHGTNQVDFIMQWCRIIGHIYRVATALEYDVLKDKIIKLNNNSQYHNLLEEVFKEDAVALTDPGYEMLLEEGVITVKYSLISDNEMFLDKIPKSGLFRYVFIDELRNIRPVVTNDIQVTIEQV